MYAYATVSVKLTYAFSAAATRGSAGAELLALGDVEEGSVGDVDAVPELREFVGDVVVLSDALGPGLGEPLLLHAAITVADIAAIARTTNRNLCTDHPLRSGVTPAFYRG